MIQTYDIAKSYRENYDNGPNFSGVSVKVPATPAKEFLGLKVNSRIGIAAGLLLNSKWMLAYSRLGYDLLTYKTVRSLHRPCRPPPNWVFVEDDGKTCGPIYTRNGPSANPAQVSSAVCFGMPSMPPSVWRKDMNKAKSGLLPGQALIASVTASPQPNWTPEQTAADFAQCANWAVESGADAIEANLSCPNVCTAEGSIYRDAAFSKLVAEAIRSGIGKRPLLLKIGYFAQQNELADFLREVHSAANGVTMVNGIARPVLTSEGKPAFGPSAVQAGVLGRSIHPHSVQAARIVRQVIAQEGLALCLLAVGGASVTKDIADFFSAGADAVLMGSSPMYCPDLAAKAKLTNPLW